MSGHKASFYSYPRLLDVAPCFELVVPTDPELAAALGKGALLPLGPLAAKKQYDFWEGTLRGLDGPWAEEEMTASRAYASHGAVLEHGAILAGEPDTQEIVHALELQRQMAASIGLQSLATCPPWQGLFASSDGRVGERVLLWIPDPDEPETAELHVPLSMVAAVGLDVPALGSEAWYDAAPAVFACVGRPAYLRLPADTWEGDEKNRGAAGDMVSISTQVKRSYWQTHHSREQDLGN